MRALQSNTSNPSSSRVTVLAFLMLILLTRDTKTRLEASTGKYSNIHAYISDHWIDHSTFNGSQCADWKVLATTEVFAVPNRPVFLTVFPMAEQPGGESRAYHLDLSGSSAGSNQWLLRYRTSGGKTIAILALGVEAKAGPYSLALPVQLTAIDGNATGATRYVIEVKFVGSSSVGTGSNLTISNARLRGISF
jgi:hypothetical protein